MNEIENSYLKRLAEDEEMLGALKTYFASFFRDELFRCTEGNEYAAPIQDIIFGQKVRAYHMARGVVDKAIDDLGKYKGRSNKKENNNNLER